LLRGELTLAGTDQITVSGTGLGAGTLELLAEDERGVRTSVGTVQVAASPAPAPADPQAPATAPTGVQLAQIAAPSTGARIVAVYRGTDAAGEPVIAVGAMPLTH
jgi:hypothetical protein